jgi:pSer/pThr/pTyr-binding forkhead associated (FHA) protein
VRIKLQVCDDEDCARPACACLPVRACLCVPACACLPVRIRTQTGQHADRSARRQASTQTGPHADRSVSFDGPRIVIGRSKDCDLRLSHPSISRHHGRIEFDPAGNWMVHDAESINGLLLNDRPVRRPRRLRQGDEISVGPVTVVVVEVDVSDRDGRAPAPSDAIDSDAFLSPLSSEATPADKAQKITVRDVEQDQPLESGVSRVMGGPHSWSHCYDRAIEALRGDVARMWKAIKARTPPHLAGEMHSLHESVEAGMSRLARVGDGIEESNERLGKLLEAARIISAPQPLRERLETILDLAIAQMGADCGFLMLYSRRTRSLRVSLQRGMADLKKGLKIEEGDPAQSRPSVTLARKAMESGVSVFSSASAARDENEAEEFASAMVSQGIHAAICASMKVESRFLGLIYVDFRDPSRLSRRPLGPEDTDWLDSLGSLAALAIENARLIQKNRHRKGPAKS